MKGCSHIHICERLQASAALLPLLLLRWLASRACIPAGQLSNTVLDHDLSGSRMQHLCNGDCAEAWNGCAGVVVGVIGLGEEMPSTVTLSAVRLLAWAMILLGVTALASGQGQAPSAGGMSVMTLIDDCSVQHA